MSSTLYGLSPKVCDTVKKAVNWLDSQQITYQFYDYRAQGLSAEQLDSWLALTDWEALFNKRSTSYRELSDQQKNSLDAQSARQLMLANPTLIKRPVLTDGSRILIGFKEAAYKEWFCK
ncbi:ArsC family reductase [Shewanella avicenniae]|uniref:ArsC family reductase n=1 Tax=Shewanella avicenniae TaxID=2814294 RepID=A0ABX7QM50_9GAMM|nr:ArsC family reductase [Shewanella avicenniae]QSX32051.1 ArsC family reductase [Shewanella avicenniae]